jgi:Domain of unknown function (DUF4062)
VNDQKRYQVFISSTYLDLLEERKAVIATLLQLDTFPAGMEMFPASDDDAWALIKGVIAQSDYYLLVIGGKYGSVDSSSNLSYTEMEYDYAVELGIPVMAFLHGKPDLLTVQESELKATRRAALESFRKKVQSAKHVKFWTSAEDLSMKVTTSFVQMQRSRPALGWVRADQATSLEDLRTIERLRRRIEELEAELKEANSQKLAEIGGLSQGSDELVLILGVDFSFADPKGSLLRSFSGDTRAKVEVADSWNGIFASFCQLLRRVCPEYKIWDGVHDYLREKHWETILRYLDPDSTKKIFDPDDEVYGVRISDVRESAELLLHFEALGLIRMVQDVPGFRVPEHTWILTPLGQVCATQLGATSKIEFDPSVNESVDEA